MTTGESKDERDRRVAKLWESLDAQKQGHIDLNGLKKGLKKIDHPLKNADDMLQNVLRTVDTNGDGYIDYSEFRAFVNHTEYGLWRLFQSIDHNQNGEIDKNELRAAFSNSGITLSTAKLDAFFEDVDSNKDGVISYAEWRDFLLFLPAYSSSNLHAVLSYYTATGNLNPEGDVHINDLQGLGTDHPFLKRYLLAIKVILYNIFPVHALSALIPSAHAEAGGTLSLSAALKHDPFLLDDDFELEWLPIPRTVAMWMSFRYYEQKLTENTPQIGYFLAGGIAGAVSRTATAPLDRLKVYLIAQTGGKEAAVQAAKDGAPLQAAGQASKTLKGAIRELWRAGGIRSLFAGNGLNVVKVMPESAIKFGAYESAKRAFARLEGHNDPKRLKPTSQFLSGGFGGMVAQCFVYPLDTLKFRMQCSTVEGGLTGNQLIAATARKVWERAGLLGFFRGLPLGVFGMFPYAAIDLTTFEYLKRALLARQAQINHCHEDDVPLNNFTTGAIGAISGGFSASVVYPLNVLRTRLQAQGTVLHPTTYSGILDVARKTLQAEGPRGFYKGLTPNLLKVAPAVSISYVVYENSKRMLGLR
ncbi:calcium-binding mitochondrial carrier protein [Aspergillus clavatus NRRL 1]|uniref:Mitochondrial thiamine pyrophosphate carrier 1 n=1 Tax=Aspergillus clavatus (strain ATCC 1007 / CBS 513.65 / DSM 816 / NCTC 3887 / NRRL 1 / QM 1276 / 107) TaxID=344612 RepID=A1C7R5_ASPCL|nr:calcium dependent mitochondrial carrier protein, putative [Aspergillus clavatus NRRL 1]EAW14436.1 calcium dependent mitochondrial carrier protein, putative [Aspergillus clavatus NRRL 1]